MAPRTPPRLARGHAPACQTPQRFARGHVLACRTPPRLARGHGMERCHHRSALTSHTSQGHGYGAFRVSQYLLTAFPSGNTRGPMPGTNEFQ